MSSCSCCMPARFRVCSRTVSTSALSPVQVTAAANSINERSCQDYSRRPPCSLTWMEVMEVSSLVAVCEGHSQRCKEINYNTQQVI